MKQLFSITLTCLNDRTTHKVAFIDKDFNGGRINWTLSLTPPIGYSRELSIDSFKFIRSDFQYIWQRFIIYGNLLKINLEVFKNGVSYGTYRIDINDGTTFHSNKCICALSASGVEAAFAAKKDSEILIPKDGMITNAGDFKEMNNIKKLDFQTYGEYYPQAPFYQYASDLITPQGTTEVQTADNYLIEFNSYSGGATMAVNIQMALKYFEAPINQSSSKSTEQAFVVISNDKNLYTIKEVPFTTLPAVGGTPARIIIQPQTIDEYINIATTGRYNVYLQVWDELYPPQIVDLQGTSLNLFFLSTVGYSLPKIDGYTIGNVFNHIFGAGNYNLQSVFVNNFFTNYDAFSRTNDNAQLKIKVSEFLTDFCKAENSVMAYENGKYTFANVLGWVEDLPIIDLDIVKDFEFSVFNPLDCQEVEVGQKMPTYKNVENSRETFNQKITWKAGDFGNKYDLSLTRMRADYTGIFDLVIEQSKGVDVQNPDYWIIQTTGENNDRTEKPDSITGLFQQTGWFNFNFSPRDLLCRSQGVWRSVLSFFDSNSYLNVSTAENLLTKVENGANGKQLDPLLVGDIQNRSFTNMGVKFTTLLTETNFLILKDKINKLEILFNGENLLVLPTSIEISPLNKQEAQITGVLINIPTK